MKNLTINPLMMISKLILILMITTISISCTYGERVKGNGLIATEERSDVQGFDIIHISAGLKAIITQGEKDFVEVEADENILKYIITEVSDNNTLTIRWKRKINVRRFKKAIVHLTMKRLKAISASSGSTVISKSSIKVDQLTINASSAADINIITEAKSVRANSSSGADIDIKGSTEDLNLNVSSGADINCQRLIAQYVKANASSGGDIKVHAVQSIKASASSGGDIEYSGNPRETNNHESSGGDVDHK